MCKAMNRNFISVIFGGWGQQLTANKVKGEIIATDVAAVSAELKEAASIIIVPGYGMAVAQAQSAVSELTRRMRSLGKKCVSQFTVAGLPGHMNVLLAS